MTAPITSHCVGELNEQLYEIIKCVNKCKEWILWKEKTLNKEKVSLNQPENSQLKESDYNYLFNTAKTLRLFNGLIKRSDWRGVNG